MNIIVIVTGLRPGIERSVTQQKKRFCGKCVLFVLRFLMVTGTFQLLSSRGTIKLDGCNNNNSTECQAEELAQWLNQQLVAGSLLDYFTQQF